VDLILLHLMLPGEDGLAICCRPRGTSADMPIVIVTARGGRLVTRRLNEAAAPCLGLLLLARCFNEAEARVPRKTAPAGGLDWRGIQGPAAQALAAG
jgi:CheY-like chemotaxis protein